jgi:Ala-tRNA(Pro) deacylase
MAIPAKVKNYLQKNKIKYEVLKHKTVFTAYDMAQTMKRKLSEIAKTLLVKVDKKYYIVVVPAHYNLDFKKVDIARESDMKNKFNTKPGAMTPFGTLHKVEVIADKALLKTKDAIFSAGSFTESLRMKVKDYLKAENAQTGNIGKKK